MILVLLFTEAKFHITLTMVLNPEIQVFYFENSKDHDQHCFPSWFYINMLKVGILQDKINVINWMKIGEVGSA